MTVEKVPRAAIGSGGAEVDGEGGAKVEGEGGLRAAAVPCGNTQTRMRIRMLLGAATRREQGMFGATFQRKSETNMILLP